ncbi:MAG: ATP-binding protein [Candidatus Lokiarchaeia archaeon]
MSGVDIYENLRQQIDKSPRMRMPKTKEIIEILKLRFTPEEAEIATYLPSDYYGAASAEEVAEASGKDVEYVREKLESMLENGSIYWLDIEGEDRYCLMPIFGFFEIPFADGKKDPETRKLAGLWDDFFKKDCDKALWSSEYRWARVLPATTKTIEIGEKIKPQPEFLTWENVREYVKAAEEHGRKMALVQCSCRNAFQNCEKPVDACIAFGSAANFFLHRGKAIKEVNADEVIDVLRRNVEAGLVLMTSNMQYGQDFICSCCTCCCGILRSLVEFKSPRVLVKSNFIPVRNADECTECGNCIEICQFDAWDDDLNWIEERCIGCGVCEVDCPVEAIKMEKAKEDIPEKGPYNAWKKVIETRVE